MKKSLIYFFLLTSICMVVSCDQSKRYDQLRSAGWLLGTWENKTEKGIAIEQWEQQNDSVLTGISYFIAGNDTLSSESIRLEQQGNNVYYVPTVKDQNNEQPVVFALTSSGKEQLVFENPDHDFPQKITYKLITSDSLLAEISGTIDGKEKVIPFPMKRTK